MVFQLWIVNVKNQLKDTASRLSTYSELCLSVLFDVYGLWNSGQSYKDVNKDLN
ncbi:Hypothetical protein CINCED_3A019190 [Cinara cedri]|uniref:Uncharacterized protein n=1 Tax=Cinara cedri TaxID=506608 RepID=A0A5E4NKD3_9HEMI|nr:Hypothetical protein CINCED_3A019190 [Cinara cedri]